jgi:hypothetical protein
LETIGITAHQEELWDTKDSAVLQDSFRIEDNRRVISLPKKENVTLPSYLQNAEKMFKSLETKLRMNAELRHVYYTHLLDYIQRGHVEVVDPARNRRVHYTCLIMRCPKENEEIPNGESYSTHSHMRKAHLH